ncbi:hypothetical protein [uncultured Kocuria sp.]|uniref:hypothetical protein n=1 Tax=uncultured Kocuria sp. TaxID=259305 RepID=UPI002638B247|nr:hypothetical protein [uncultured Kocuria sp.]
MAVLLFDLPSIGSDREYDADGQRNLTRSGVLTREGGAANLVNMPQPRIAVLPDTPDARLLVELTSHANDLSEAAHALGCAFDAGEGSSLWEPLTSHAVTAYVRPFIISNVRARLDEMPEIPSLPPNLRSVHDRIRKYRNTTIAHSQSELVMPLPVAILNDEGHGVDVIGVTLIHPMPHAFAQRFAELISASEDIVDQATQPVLERLRAWLRDETPKTISDWQQPEIINAVDTDFTAARARKRIPRFTRYWHVAHLPGHEQPDE